MIKSHFKWYYSRSVILFLTVVAWVGALTILVLYSPKYLPAGDLLLFTDFDSVQKRDNRICTNDFGCWTCKGNVSLAEKTDFETSAGVKLTPSGKWGSTILWNLHNPQRFDFLEISGKIRTEEIIMGKEGFDIARVLLYFVDHEGRPRWNYPHTAKGLIGSSPWMKFSNTFQVPDFALSAHVLIQNGAKSGSMWVDHISLRPARLNHQFFRNRNILLGIGILLALAFLYILNIWKNFGWIIPVILAVSALGVLCPDIYMQQIAGILKIKVVMLKKTGHFLVFLTLGISCSLWLQHRSKAKNSIGMSMLHMLCLFLALALFAALTEFLQLLTIDRSPALMDYLTDISGIFIGLLLAFLLRRKVVNGFKNPD
jgi:hypothetical protein